MTPFGKTLLIANPTSQNGKGRIAVQKAEELLRPHLHEDLEIKLTEYAGHGGEIAATAGDYQTIIALGGDGIVHEVAGGLMKLACADRPVFSVLPMGSGNDYARTLNMTTGVEAAASELLNSVIRPADVGVCNGEYFVETLSFGLDAAIALDTMERRKHTKKIEAALYFESGIDQLLHHLDTYHFTIEIDGKNCLEDDAIMFAVQNGVTYGGGFRICPDAQIDDGVFDICYANPTRNVARAVYIFGKAKTGNHAKYHEVHFTRGSQLKLSFDRRPPCQMDGEPHIADSYDISILKQALRVRYNPAK